MTSLTLSRTPAADPGLPGQRANGRTWSARIARAFGAGLVAVLAIVAPEVARANTLQTIDASLQGGQTVVQLGFAEPLAAVPTGFTIDQPARVVLDFPGVTSALPRNALNVTQGNLRSADLVEAQGRARLVLNLRAAATYTTRIDGRKLLVTLNAPAGAAAANPGGQVMHFAAAASNTSQALRAIDFHRGPDGSGQVVVTLPNSQVGVDIRQDGQNIVVEFLHSSLPPDLRRRLEVGDFATPVRSITTFEVGDKVRMVVQPSGNYQQSAYQADDKFVLEVHPQVPNPNQLVAGNGPGYHGQKLSLNFQNIDVRSLLEVFQDFTGLNVVVSDSVTGNLTLRLHDVPWDQALDLILQAKGLGERKQGNVLWIAPRDEIVAREKADLEAQQSLQSIETLKSETFQLNYQTAANVVRLLTGAAGGVSATPAAPAPLAGLSGAPAAVTSRILSPRGTVIADQRTNQVFVTDIPSKLEEISNFISKIDKPVRQVLIEARIVEASDLFGRELGAKLGISSPVPRASGTGIGLSGDYLGVAGATGQPLYGSTVAMTDTQLVNLPATSIANSVLSGVNPGTMAISLFNAGAGRFINLELSALEADGAGKVISSPRVITADMQKAQIKQGTEIPYQAATSSGATAVSFQNAVLSLDVTPQITPDGNVIMAVEIHKDSVGQNTNNGPAINTNVLTTQVQVENGGTVVLGGIYTEQQQNQTDKVPLLGDIPVFGYLFKTTSKSAQKDELMIFLTPKIVQGTGAGVGSGTGS